MVEDGAASQGGLRHTNAMLDTRSTEQPRVAASFADASVTRQRGRLVGSAHSRTTVNVRPPPSCGRPRHRHHIRHYHHIFIVAVQRLQRSGPQPWNGARTIADRRARRTRLTAAAAASDGVPSQTQTLIQRRRGARRPSAIVSRQKLRPHRAARLRARLE
jgi:hypothetical protein